MDSRLRQILRDPRTTPFECYWELLRAGMSHSNCYAALLGANKIPLGFGYFETLQMEAGELTLAQARQKVADEAYFEYEFDDEVEAANGWEISGDYFSKRVFLLRKYGDEGQELEPDEEVLTYTKTLAIHFAPNSCIISDVNEDY